MVSPCKEINYAAETSALLMTTDLEYMSFEIMLPKSHKNLEMIPIEK